MRDNRPPGYDALTRLLHWLVALLLIIAFGLGWWLSGLGLFDSRQTEVSMWHKSLGLLVVTLTVLRMAWRWRQQPLPGVGSKLEQALARVVRAGLYVLVLLAAISGYLLATGSGRELDWFGVLLIPPLVELEQATLGRINDVHAVSVWLLAAVVAVHVLAVIKHQLFDRQAVLRRML